MPNAAQRVFRFRPSLGCLAILAGLTAAAGDTVHAAITIIEGGAATPAGLTATRDAFRSAVGGGNVAAANGDFGGLRREINWDGVPDARSDPAALPADFFNVTSPRGVVFSSPTAGASFIVSANAGQATPALFGFPLDLQAFSAQRLFATLGSRITDIRFFVPGTTTAATTGAFGAVFVDTENNDSTDFTQMEFFDLNDTRIFSHNVPVAGNQGLSFLGGVADAGERIARVRITTPDNVLLANGQRSNEVHDFVIMDDFLYASPVAVPEPASWALGLFGLAFVGFRARNATTKDAAGRQPIPTASTLGKD